MVSHNNDSSLSIPEQAAQWWVLLNDEHVSAAEKNQFWEWVVRSPERVEAYLQVAGLHSALRSSDLRWPTTPADQLIREALAAPADPVPLREQRERRPTMRWQLGIAASMLIAICATWLSLSRPERFETKVGEQRSVMLEDGSRVTLNTDSRIEVRIGERERKVQLLRGQALFEVSRDAARPFYVDAGSSILRVVGTQFDVYRQQDQTVVTILEGRVAVLGHMKDESAQAPILTAADRMTVSRDGARRIERDTDIAAATAWLHGRLVFEHRPLGEVVAEFNRYNLQRIHILSPELNAEEITGTFGSKDTTALATFIAGIPGARVASDGEGGYVVTMDPKAASLL